MNAAATNQAPRFTPQQHKAVQTRQVSVSLSAGAGCGKTFVLTERYLSHLDPHDPQSLSPDQIGQLVAITFTDRAAREMRDRIRRRCYERLRSADNIDADYWARLLRALDNARISTIHAFCASLLRSRAVEAGLDPQFAVLEQPQADTLLSEAVDDEVRRLISERDETTLELAVQFGLDGLRAMVRQFVLEATPPLLDQWLEVSPEEVVKRWAAFFLELKPTLAAQVASSPAARCVRKIFADYVPTHPGMRDRRAALLSALDRLAELAPGNSLLGLLQQVDDSARVQGGGGAAAWPNPELYESFRDAATQLRKQAKDLAGVAAFDPDEARDAAELGTRLLQLASGVYAAYDARKTELRVLDFGDLLVRARALLVGDAQAGIAQQLGEKITLLLVDEFQDTDPLQVELVEALCGEGLQAGKLFFVGDHKQSIYRFRGANPHVFAALRERTPPEGRLDLTQNFRSQPAILQFVNGLFWHDLGDDYQPLRAHREQVSPRPAVEFLWAPNPNGNRESAEQIRAREAEWLARRLRAILDSGDPLVWDAAASAAGGPATRPAQLGDIAILLRALTNVEAYESALRKYEIDYYLVGGHAFYAQQEIYDLLNLLRALNSAADVVSLVGVLRSPFFSLSDESIFWLSQHPAGIPSGLACGKFPEAMSPAEQRQAAFAGRTLAHLRACKDRLRISELIELALSLTGYDAVLLNEFLGERKLANLLKLQEQARSFQRGDFLGLADFIAQLSEFVVRQPDEPLAAMHSEDTNVVRLMSIHQAKGLEFPIVVVPDMNRMPHGGANRVHFDVRLGPLARLPNGDDEPRAASGYDLWRHAERIEEAAESNRLLYVATTRAADYLILSGGVNALGDANSPWMQLLSRRFDLIGGHFLGELPAGEVRPVVRVTSQEPPAPKRGGQRATRVDIAELTARLAKTPASMFPVRPAVDPISPDPAARRQFSFSRLSGKLHRKFERLDESAAGRLVTPDPRGLGTLIHAVLAAIDFSRKVKVSPLVERFAEQHLPDAPRQIEDAVEMIERFIRSPRARQLAASPSSHAEVEFLLAWSSARKKVGDGTQSGEVALRGYLDRLYQDTAGGWHVLDFKTNRIGSGGIAKQAADYEMQMLVYGLATERILKVPPASLTLHFLRSGEEFSFAWDDAARERVVRLVDQGIAAAIARPADVVASPDASAGSEGTTAAE
jgi:ATP-dependent helicase/nuclease subunit A